MKPKLHILAALFILLAVTWTLPSQPVHAAEKKAKERLAVLDLEAKYGVKKDFAEGLSVIVRDKIHSYGEFQVMSQEDIQAVASREQMKQALGCDDGSGQCLIDFGRQIGTRFMVAGSVSKFGSTYTVSLRMLDTQGDNAGVVNRVSENCKCSEDDLIGTAQNVAASLVGKPNNAAAKKAAEEEVKRLADEKKKAAEAEQKRLAEEKKKAEEAERQRQATIAEERRKVEEAKQKLATETERLKQEKLAAELEKLKKEKEREIEAEQKRLAELLKKEDEAAQKKIAVKDGNQGAALPPRPSASPTGKLFKDPTTGMEFVLVPPGCFQMGDTHGEGNPTEKPVHEVCVDGFYLGKYEVTQEEYQKIMKANPSAKKGDRYPVESVSWVTAQDFIAALGIKSGKDYRLPTEAEWEYAARAGGNDKFSGGNDPNAVAWYVDNSGGSIHPVGQKQPNSWGLYDMSGNVWEWCGDWFNASYYKNSPHNKPDGPSVGSGRVNRGGSWDSNTRKIRTTNRDAYSPDRGFRNLGFRLVLPSQRL